MVILLGLVAFAVDIGYLTLTRTEFQGIADSCALAAVSRLPSETEAQTAAVALATAHEGPTGSPVLATDVEFGIWGRDELTFDPHAVGPANAVRVTIECSAERGNPLKLFFADILHRPLGDVKATATASYDHLLGGPFSPSLAKESVAKFISREVGEREAERIMRLATDVTNPRVVDPAPTQTDASSPLGRSQLRRAIELTYEKMVRNCLGKKAKRGTLKERSSLAGRIRNADALHDPSTRWLLYGFQRKEFSEENARFLTAVKKLEEGCLGFDRLAFRNGLKLEYLDQHREPVDVTELARARGWTQANNVLVNEAGEAVRFETLNAALKEDAKKGHQLDAQSDPHRKIVGVQYRDQENNVVDLGKPEQLPVEVRKRLQKVRGEAERIYEEFVPDGAPTPINLSSSRRRQLTKRQASFQKASPYDLKVALRPAKHEIIGIVGDTITRLNAELLVTRREQLAENKSDPLRHLETVKNEMRNDDHLRKVGNVLYYRPDRQEHKLIPRKEFGGILWTNGGMSVNLRGHSKTGFFWKFASMFHPSHRAKKMDAAKKCVQNLLAQHFEKNIGGLSAEPESVKSRAVHLAGKVMQPWTNNHRGLSKGDLGKIIDIAEKWDEMVNATKKAVNDENSANLAPSWNKKFFDSKLGKQFLCYCEIKGLNNLKSILPFQEKLESYDRARKDFLKANGSYDDLEKAAKSVRNASAGIRQSGMKLPANYGNALKRLEQA